MTTRASKRLKVAAEKAVATVSTTAKKEAKTTTRKKNVHAEAVESTVETDVVTAKAKASDKTTKAASSKDAWGALFASKKSASSRGDKWIRPKHSEISEEIKAKVDAYATFDGVTGTRGENVETKIVAWNVNGLRALLKKDDTIHFRAYVAQEDPDILCLSETKICSEELQKLDDVLPQYEHQYWSSAAKKGYAGTVVFTKTKPLSVKDEIVAEGSKPDDEGRFLALEYDKFWLVHTYVPNSGMKLDRLSYRTEQWDKAMLRMLEELEKTGKHVIWCGDLNVAHQEIDIHDPKGNRNKSPGFTDAERESFSDMLDAGFVDTYRHFHPETKQYTYWSYRFNAKAKNKGWRLDYFVVSKALVDHVASSFVRDAVSGSDHVPIGLELRNL